MINWIKSLFKAKTDFELSFSELKYLGKIQAEEGDSAYSLLAQLDKSTPDKKVEELISKLKKISYSSNTNGVFHFYFPIVSHILFYKPTYENQILGLLIGPNFANGMSDAGGIIIMVQRAMDYKIKENPKHFTEESKLWVRNSLPKMMLQVKREIDLCRKELED